jgi:hypothetical protein
MQRRCQGTNKCTLKAPWRSAYQSSFATESETAPWTAAAVYSCKGLTLQTCGKYGPVLGGPGQLERGSSLSAAFTLPKHNKVRVDATILAIDSWDAERLNMKLDGITVASQVVSKGAGDITPAFSQECGRLGSEPHTLEVPVRFELEFYHTKEDVEIAFETTLDGILGDESFALLYFALYTADTDATFANQLYNAQGDQLLAREWGLEAPHLSSATLQCAPAEGGAMAALLPFKAGDTLTQSWYNLPPHDLLQLTLTLWVDEGDDTGVIMVHADGNMIAMEKMSGLPGSLSCMQVGDSGISMRRVTLTSVLTHAVPALDLRVSSSGVFALSGVQVQANESPLDCLCSATQFLLGGGASGCGDCDPACATCSGAGSNACTSCPSGSVLTSDKGCKPCGTCDTGFFTLDRCDGIVDTVCEQCHPSCFDCSGPGIESCLACAAGFEFGDSSICLPVCGDGQALNEETNTCGDCPARCAACSDGTACDDCEEGAFLTDGGDCVLNCPAGTFASAAAGRCLACAEDCQTCDGPTSEDCTACSGSAYELLTLSGDRECIRSCPQGYFAVAELRRCQFCSSGCEEGEYLTQSCAPTADIQCAACDASCRTCDGPERCTSCPVGHFLRNGACAECRAQCGAGEYLVGECTTFSDPSCIPCDSSCATCSSARVCLTCLKDVAPNENGACIQPQASSSKSGEIGGVPIWVLPVVLALVLAVVVFAVIAVRRGRRSRADDGPVGTTLARPEQVRVNGDVREASPQAEAGPFPLKLSNLGTSLVSSASL